MCGIIGYAGGKRAAEICYEGLLRLEYRGYDSAGIAVLNGGKISVYKRAGKVTSVRGAIEYEGNAGIGHTRWATHGAPDERNAHPHVAGKFAVVHNGIIENYAELKAELIKDGCGFLSDTDSEVAACLINKYYVGDPVAAVRMAAARLKGSYALCVLCEDYDGVIAAKKNSPLIVGYGEGENFVTSDIPALAGRAKFFSVLADGDCALVTRGGVKIFNGAGRSVKRLKRKNLIGDECVLPCGYRHFMLKEINEVPRAVSATAENFASLPKDKLGKLFSEAESVIITGCGTAYNAALAAKEYFTRIGGVPCEAEVASEFRYSRPVPGKNKLVIAVSQSGETADTVEAAKLARRCGAKVIAVTNVPYSAITRASDYVVPICAGQEVCVAATKSYTAQVAVLYILACFTVGRADEARAELLKTAAACKKILKDSDGLDGCARIIKDSRAVFFLGRGGDFAAAREGSLKLKEVSYVFSDGYAAGELKHGTLALIDNNTVSVVIMTKKRLVEKCENAVEQIASRGGKVITVTSDGGAAKRMEGRGTVVKISAPCERLSAIPVAVACQLIAYKTAVSLGHNPDKPRNLAKSVTVE